MKANLIFVVIAICVAGSLAANYTFVNMSGGSWKTESNWEPAGVPGPDDNVLFTYLDGMNSDLRTVTLDGDIVVNTFTVDVFGFQFQSGSLTVQNDCDIQAGLYYRINITLNGVSGFKSIGSGGSSGIMCDGCTINVKKSLEFVSFGSSGNTEFANNAYVITYEGANTTLYYGSIHSLITQAGTLINYGNLIFGNGFGFGSSPWGNPPVTETGPFKEIKNYGNIWIQVRGSPLPSPVYNDIKTWNFYDGKLILRVVQESTTNDHGVININYEYNDCISSGGAHDYYEVNIGGDVHIIFDQADVLPGQPDQPFDPKVGDFFPVFASFDKFSGQIRKITFEGLGSGMALGRSTRMDSSTQLYLVGVVICSSSDTTCLNASGDYVDPDAPKSAPTSDASVIAGSFMAISAVTAMLF